jgi:integrase
VFPRKLDAERHLTQVEHSKLTGAYVDPIAGRITFKSYAEQWRAAQVHRPGTATSVEQQLRRHVYPTIGKRPIGAIRPGEIQALVTKMSDKLAASTVAVVYGRIVAVFRSAVRDRVIVRSPCEEIRLPGTTPASMLDVLTTEQVVAIADAIAPRYRALVLTAAGTGLRPGELFGLTVDRVDFLRREVRVDRQLVRVRGEGIELAPPKTVASYRTVPLPDMVADALAAHLSEYEPHEWGLIFTNERGGPVQERPFRGVWETARRKAKAPTWATPHDLRHFYASTLIRSGASVKVVQARLGHASAKTTLDTYGHIFPDEADRTRDAVDTAFGALPQHRAVS